MKAPTVFRRARDTIWICVVRTRAGRPVMRGTACRHEDAALQYANLLQRDITRRAEMGDLLPTPKLRNRKPKQK